MQPTTASDAKRISSVDFIRGLIMLIMAIDHLRDYFHITAYTANPLDLSVTTPALFFTRWITHLCAPGFLFLSGMSAFLSVNKGLTALDRIPSERSSFLIKRGLFIALFDICLMSLIMSFNITYSFAFITVLWAIGCSMLLLGVVLKISPKAVLPIGLIIFFGHDIMTGWLMSDMKAGNGLLRMLFTGIYFVPLDSSHTLAFIYSILPWTAIMFIGYGGAPLLNGRKKMIQLGLGFLILFIILRFINQYGDMPWKKQDTAFKTFMAFINTSKYPPSLQFGSMILGLICLLLAAAQNASGAFQQFASVYGRTPFFYFVMHFLLGHILLVIVFYATGHTASEIRDPNTLIWFRPQQFGFELPMVYGIWLFIVLLLYYPCKRFYAWKRSSRSSVAKYL